LPRSCWTAWVLGLAVLVLISAPPALGAYKFGSTVTSDGVFDVAYDYDWDSTRINSCDQWHIPDGGTRAFRDANGNVQVLLSTSYFNGRMLGTTLDNVKPEQLAPELGGRPCVASNLHPSGSESDPARHHDSEWIDSLYRDASTNVIYALLHNEYNGARYYPAHCSQSWPNGDCQEITVTSATSTDNGATYDHSAAPPPTHLVTSLPYMYVNDWGHDGALTNLTNMVRNPSDGYYYAIGLIQAAPTAAFPAPTSPTTTTSRGYLGAQDHGLCAIRTPSLVNPTWRAWDGDASDDSQNGFTVRFIDPYVETTADPAEHVCAPLDALGGPTNAFLSANMSFNSFFDKWMIIGSGWPRGPQVPMGAYYSLSDDLVHWSDPRLLMEYKTAARYKNDGCTGDLPMDYPSILDPSDTSTNFERSDGTAELYLTRFNTFMQGCIALADRDLVRVSVQFHRPLRWATGRGEDCGGGFDEYVAGPGGFGVDAGHNYSGASTAYQASTTAANPSAYGAFTRDSYPPESPCSETNRPGFRFPSGSDVRYSGAFRFEGRPSGDLTFMRLANRSSGGQAASTLSLTPSGKVLFNTDPSGAGGDEVSLLQDPSGVALPNDTCWHFFEVHQTLGTGSNGLNELWIDGQRVNTVTATNFHGQSYDRIEAGAISGPAPYTLYTDMVGFAYSGSQLWYFGCRGAG
jgi:hypothetical protein